MFNKPISQIEEKEIQALVDGEQKESLILEYKREVSGTDKEKKELSKDISAMANTEGGFFIIGIEENDGMASKLVGTGKLIGNQPVEEWVENILISNVRPKLIVRLKAVPLSSDENKVILVIQIPQSSRRPHMVTIEGKNAYYKRHNYQAAYADEHEVRSMFLESKTSIDEMKNFLEERNLNDSQKDTFARTPLSEEISNTLSKLKGVPEDFQGKPFVLFASCPRYLEERVDIASSDFRMWLDQKNTIELFDLNIEFLDHDNEISADSIRSIHEAYLEKETVPRRYVEIFRNGYIENGLGDDLMWSANEKHKDIGLLFQIAYFTASFWLFLKFVKDAYNKIGYVDEISVIVGLSDIKGITLHGFGNKNKDVKWQEPYDFMRGFDKLPKAKQKNFRYTKNVIVSELGDKEIEEIVKEVSVRVSNAFGERIAKCFDDDGNFDRNQLRGFRNVK